MNVVYNDLYTAGRDPARGRSRWAIFAVIYSADIDHACLRATKTELTPVVEARFRLLLMM